MSFILEKSRGRRIEMNQDGGEDGYWGPGWLSEMVSQLVGRSGEPRKKEAVAIKMVFMRSNSVLEGNNKLLIRASAFGS